jgi:UDP-N-acetylglucosamine 2-epimerase (non-hydrolysing)
VSGPARAHLGQIDRVNLCPPFDYPALIGVLQRAYLVLTDSGGIQEEAPALGKPVLVARDTTERGEAIATGVACLVGTDSDRIVAVAQRLLDDPAAYHAMVRRVSPFGDGHASVRICDALADYMHGQTGTERNATIPRMVYKFDQ